MPPADGLWTPLPADVREPQAAMQRERLVDTHLPEALFDRAGRDLESVGIAYFAPPKSWCARVRSPTRSWHARC